MTQQHRHLTPDEFDDWLAQRLDLGRVSHLETCSDCHGLAEADRWLVTRLSALPMLAPRNHFADGVMAAIELPAIGRMASLAAAHITPDEIDAWLAGTLDSGRHRHLESCAECRELAETEGELVAQLTALPLLAPTAEFANRVLASLAAGQPALAFPSWRDRILGSPRSHALAAGLAAVAVASMGGSVAWSLSHQETITAAGAWFGNQAGQWFWVALRGGVSNLIEQPWYPDLRHLFGSPARLATLSAAASVLYLSGVLALRRLLAIPLPQASRAAI